MSVNPLIFDKWHQLVLHIGHYQLHFSQQSMKVPVSPISAKVISKIFTLVILIYFCFMSISHIGFTFTLQLPIFILDPYFLLPILLK